MMMQNKEEIRKSIMASMESFQKIRREFHRIPELGLEEYKTTDLICKYLSEMKIEACRLDPTGVVAYIGPKDAATIALRADIDALAIKEETGLPFASCHEGKMHACGHDGHIAGLLGAAAYLKDKEEELTVRVKLIFQPSEENTLGAKHIIKNGVLSDVDHIFGLHLFTDLPYGIVNVQEGPRMAQTDRFTVRFEGKGGHAGKPHLCVDATVMAAEFVMSVQSIVGREINPVEGAVATVGSFHSGTQYNIISQRAELSGTCRSFSVDTAQKLRAGIERRAHAIASAYGGSVSIEYDFGSHPPVINDPAFSKEILQEIQEILPEKDYREVAPLMLGEDFSWYQAEIPGVFAFVGSGNEEKGILYPNHHPEFDIEEQALCDSVCLHIAAVLAFEKKNK